MMKQILLLFIFLFVTSMAFGQDVEVLADFDNIDLAGEAAFGNGSQDGVVFPVVENPNKDGINVSDSVQIWHKGTGSQTWAGYTYSLGDKSINMTEGGYGKVCIDVLSDHQFKLLVKIQEDGNVEPKAAFTAWYSKVDSWEQVCVDLQGIDEGGTEWSAVTDAVDYQKLVFFPDFGTVPEEETTYYFDNIVKTTGGDDRPDLTVYANHEDVDLPQGAAFGNGGLNMVFPIIENPVKDGINTSDSVQTWRKDTEANNVETWAGFVYDLTENPMNLTAATWGTVCVDVLSDHIFKLRLKIQESGNFEPKASYDKWYSKVDQWERVCFDLMGQDIAGEVFNSNGADAVNYKTIVFFPDFGIAPADETLYHFDNLTILTPGWVGPIGTVVSDYEATETTKEMDGSFSNGHWGSDLFPIEDNPSPDAVNSSAKVQKWCKANDADNWAGFYIDHELDFTGDLATLCFSVYADIATTFRLKIEGADAEPNSAAMDQEYDTPGAWQHICFDFTQPGVDDVVGQGNIYPRFTIFPHYGSVPSEDQCFFIDDIYEQSNGVGEVLKTIGELLEASSDHSTLNGLLTTYELWSAVNAAETTVFAPNNAAFAAMDASELDAIMNNTGNAAFDFIYHHVTNSVLLMADLNMGMVFLAGNGQDATVTVAGTEVDGANISDGDIKAENGYLHITDVVMTLPDNPESGYVYMDNETEATTPSWGWTPVTIIDNPSPTGINTSAKVANFIKTPGGPWWQGSLSTPARVINFRDGVQEMCVDMLTDHEGTVKFKLEQPVTPLPEAGGSPATYMSFESSSSTADEWTQICSDIAVGSYKDAAEMVHVLSGETHMFRKPVFFLDFVDLPLPADTVNFYLDNFLARPMVVFTNDIEKLENFSFFPNPTNNSLMLKSDTPIARAIIFSSTGNRVLEIQNPLNKDIDVSQFTSGMYFIGLHDEKGNYLGTAKFVKN